MPEDRQTPLHLSKRFFDIAAAAVGLAITAPVMAVIAIAVRATSSGPAIYRASRIGLRGKPFTLYKFRSMRTTESSEGTRITVAGDNRITGIGKLLRATKLDELPQLVNVMRGDMSIVGPRPPIPYEVEAYELRHRKRLDMKPGLTGLWQVSGRNRLPFEEMVKLDLFYIENWSLLFDLKIILRTVLVMMRGDGY